MKVFFITTLSLSLLSPTWCPADNSAHNWPQWRGPTRDGYAPSGSWPETLSKDNLKQIWHVKLGPSYSGPIIQDGQVFTTETVDKKREVVRAFDALTGKENWQTAWEGALKVPFFARANGSWIRSTPACDGERLYVAGIRDVLVCLDLQDGKELWQVDFVKEFKTPVPSFGFVCSPLIIDDHIFVQAGGSLVKLNKNTGEVIWRTMEDGGGMWASAFSSPVFTHLHDQAQLVVQTRQQMAGVDIESGKVLWSQDIKAFRGMNILTPIVYREKLFTSAHSGRSELFSLTPTEDGFSVSRDWDNKSMAYMSTPVVLGDYLYMHLKNQRFTCIDLRNGKSQWTTKPYGKYWSMVVQGDRILALDERGYLYLIEAHPDAFKLISELHISNAPTWAHLGISDQLIFIRELGGLAAYRWTDKEE